MRAITTGPFLYTVYDEASTPRQFHIVQISKTSLTILIPASGLNHTCHTGCLLVGKSQFQLLRECQTCPGRSQIYRDSMLTLVSADEHAPGQSAPHHLRRGVDLSLVDVGFSFTVANGLVPLQGLGWWCGGQRTNTPQDKNIFEKQTFQCLYSVMSHSFPPSICTYNILFYPFAFLR